jgi:hypothetical protein
MECYIKVDLGETVCEYEAWIQRAHDIAQWWYLASTAITLGFHTGRNFLDQVSN